MEGAFDPAFGEAWNRRQVSDALVLANCRCHLLDVKLQVPDANGKAAGFTLSRQILDEEELLLIAVLPAHRRNGIAGALMDRLIADARARGVTRMFLEMRDGNPAEALYRQHGFEPVGRRPNYYNRGSIAGIDAITFALGL
ncbi:GNAT family N-acetyltransferase [Erythrobacter sp. SG61-1L]|uniref:GNAT family N-acetyltransferase n=1 Tax=Erythrobacter sp. SG61-1L TaxID=1603897 RepID=UPI001F522174|nr:GNAT family N-acetyltransferase [Erythrobacter sp. SG61-1L]